MYYHVWDLAGQPKGDPCWGESHAFDNRQRLANSVKALATDHFRELSQPDLAAAFHTGNALLAQIAPQQFINAIDEWADGGSPGEHRQEAARRIIDAFENRSRELSLNFLRLKNLPPEIRCLSNLRSLIIAYHQLTSLPPAIGNLSKLQNLIAYHSQLTSVPSELGNLSKLETLDLSHNRLDSLPPEIGNLSNLTHLNLSHNRLNSLPPEIGNLSNLTYLVLNQNQLTYLQAFKQPLPSLNIYSTCSDLENLSFLTLYASCNIAERVNVFDEDRHKLFSVVNDGKTYSLEVLEQTPHELSFELAIIQSYPEKNLRESIEELSEDTKNEIYHRVWHLAGRPLDGDPNWGEHHAYDDLPRLYKAYNSLDFPEDFQNYTPPSAG